MDKADVEESPNRDDWVQTLMSMCHGHEESHAEVEAIHQMFLDELNDEADSVIEEFLGMLEPGSIMEQMQKIKSVVTQSEVRKKVRFNLPMEIDDAPVCLAAEVDSETKGLTTKEMLSMATGPRERTAEESQYGRGDRGNRGYGGFDDERRQGADRDMPVESIGICYENFTCPEQGMVFFCGSRREMEDVVSVLPAFNYVKDEQSGSALHFFSGHGGSQTAVFCQERLHKVLVEEEIVFSAKEIELREWKGDILAVGVFEKDVSSGMFENGRLKELDGYVHSVLSKVAKEEDFSGKIGQTAFARLPGFGFQTVVVPERILESPL